MHEHDQTALLEAHAENLGVYLRAAEDWVDQYRKDPKSLTTLIAAEQRMLTSMRRYFRELPERGHKWVNWRAYSDQLHASVSAIVDIKDSDLVDEGKIVMRLVFDDMTIMTATGAQAGERIYNIPLGLSKSSQAVVAAAQKRAAALVKDINETTRTRVNQSVTSSLQLGESIQEATDRLSTVLNDTVRAERVARTESVTAYNSGLNVFGAKSGAESKTWQAVPDSACPICADLDGTTVAIDDEYSPDVGDGPPGHPNCRCGQVLNYPAAPDTSNADE